MSISQFAVWQPGEPMTGDVDAPLDGYPFREGVFALKNRDVLRHCLTGSVVHAVVHAIGQVALYGEVVEHEFGYRASHAMVHSIDEIGGQMADDPRSEAGADRERMTELLDGLRAIYLTDDRQQMTEDR
jgi:hypothetical protein